MWGKRVNKQICNRVVVEVKNIDFFLNRFLIRSLSTVEEQARGISLTELERRVSSIAPALQTSYYRALSALKEVVKRTSRGLVKEGSILELKVYPTDQPEILGAEDGQILIAQAEPKGLVSVTPKTKIDIVLKRSG